MPFLVCAIFITSVIKAPTFEKTELILINAHVIHYKARTLQRN